MRFMRLLGVLTVVVGAFFMIASNALATPSASTVRTNGGWTVLGGDSIVKGGVWTRSAFVHLITSQKGQTALAYARLNAVERDAITTQVRMGNFSSCTMKYGESFEWMSFGINGTTVDSNVTFADPNYKNHPAPAWCVQAIVNGKLVLIKVPKKCGNIAVPKRKPAPTPPVVIEIPVCKTGLAKDNPVFTIRVNGRPAQYVLGQCQIGKFKDGSRIVVTEDRLTGWKAVPRRVYTARKGLRITVHNERLSSPPPAVCPADTVGTPPTCTTPPPAICPAGTTGTPPNCVTPPPAPVVFCMWNGQPLFAAPPWNFNIQNGVCVAVAVTTTCSAEQHVEKNSAGVDVCINNVNTNTNTNVNNTPVVVNVTPPAVVVTAPVPTPAVSFSPTCNVVLTSDKSNRVVSLTAGGTASNGSTPTGAGWTFVKSGTTGIVGMASGLSTTFTFADQLTTYNWTAVVQWSAGSASCSGSIQTGAAPPPLPGG